jgi:hypothetical protein
MKKMHVQPCQKGKKKMMAVNLNGNNSINHKFIPSKSLSNSWTPPTTRSHEISSGMHGPGPEQYKHQLLLIKEEHKKNLADPQFSTVREKLEDDTKSTWPNIPN